MRLLDLDVLSTSTCIVLFNLLQVAPAIFCVFACSTSTVLILACVLLLGSCRSCVHCPKIVLRCSPQTNGVSYNRYQRIDTTGEFPQPAVPKHNWAHKAVHQATPKAK